MRPVTACFSELKCTLEFKELEGNVLYARLRCLTTPGEVRYATE